MECCIFKYLTANQTMSNFDFEEIEDYGKGLHDDEGNCITSYVAWDDGNR